MSRRYTATDVDSDLISNDEKDHSKQEAQDSQRLDFLEQQFYNLSRDNSDIKTLLLGIKDELRAISTKIGIKDEERSSISPVKRAISRNRNSYKKASIRRKAEIKLMLSSPLDETGLSGEDEDMRFSEYPVETESSVEAFTPRSDVFKGSFLDVLNTKLESSNSQNSANLHSDPLNSHDMYSSPTNQIIKSSVINSLRPSILKESKQRGQDL